MPRKARKPAKPMKQPAEQSDVPPGATRKAFRRPVDPGGGPEGSAAGPRHAADDVGSENETTGATDFTRSPASPPLEEEDWLEKGPPFSGRAGGAVGGTPAQARSTEGSPQQRSASLQNVAATNPTPPESPRADTQPELNAMRLTGFAAIEYAEKQNLPLNKHPDRITGPRVGLSVAEARAIADEDADLIWLDVSKEDYYDGPITSYEPER